MEDDLLERGRQDAGEDRQAEDDGDDDQGDDRDLAPARLAVAAGSATVSLGRDADRRHEDLAGMGGAAPRQRGRSWGGGT